MAGSLGEEEGDDREGVGRKSQSPKRRKQALQVASPGMWSVSACQPKRARVRARWLILGCGGWVVGSFDWVEEVSWESRCRSDDSCGESWGGSKVGGGEMLEGSSGAIFARES